MLPINLFAVLVAAIVAFVLGFLFHGPLLGKTWMRLANIHPTGNEKMSDMYGQMFWNLVVNIITAYTLAVVYMFASHSPFTNGTTLTTGLMCGFLVWLGFLVTTTSIEVIWMGKKRNLWLFEVGCSLIVMLAMSAIISLM